MRTLKILAVVLVALALGVGAVWLWIRHAADRKWAAAQERIQQLSAAHPVVVPPLPSTPASKDLQIQFVAAIREAARRIGRESEASRLVRWPEEGQPADSVLEDAEDFRNLLHQVARQCVANPAEFPPGWRVDWDTDTLGFMMDCSVLRARHLRGQKSAFEAAETILDAFQLVRFWASSGKGENRLDAASGILETLRELGSILSNETLSRDQLRAIDRELEPIEQILPTPVKSLEVGMTRWAEGLIPLDPGTSGHLNLAPYRWRYLLPGNLMKADAFDFVDCRIQRLAGPEDSVSLPLLKRVQQVYSEMDGSKNPLLPGITFMKGEWLVLERLTLLRLLRVAAHYRASGEVVPLKDPYGDKFLHSRTDTRMKFWSRDAEHKEDFVIEVDHPTPE